jgi:uncharacterized flavoprotein (TIGR03862 family)
MAAEGLSQYANVVVCDAMPTAGRKFLMAGVGGMNITHSEPLAEFTLRYRSAADWLRPMLQQFGPAQLRDWIHLLGIETFVGSSGRVFPRDMKAAPLLRGWLQRLRSNGVQFALKHRWVKSDGKRHFFLTSEGEKIIEADVVVFALGGGSWKKLGSDGVWATAFEQMGVQVTPLLPSNCGFEVAWREHLRVKFAGSPIKPVGLRVKHANAAPTIRQGEFMLTGYGVEGTSIYALSADIRQQLQQHGIAHLLLDLLPQHSEKNILALLNKPRGKKSLSAYLQTLFHLNSVKLALLYERVSKDNPSLASALKALPITINACRPIDEAISTAGGICRDELTDHLMLKKWPGAFCAGEMLDWEAPTGGYLLTACFATGYRAGMGAAEYLKSLNP